MSPPSRVGLEHIQPPPRPAERGNARAVTHGASAELQLAPRVEELRAMIAELVPVGTLADEPAITLLSWQLARIERANAYLDEHGLMDRRGVPRPVLKVLSTWENSAARLCDALGLSPTSRAKLKLDEARALHLTRQWTEVVETTDDTRLRGEIEAKSRDELIELLADVAHGLE